MKAGSRVFFAKRSGARGRGKRGMKKKIKRERKE